MKQNNVGLHITKYLNSTTYNKGTTIKFAVVDLNEPEEYPLNFVCVLPRHIDPNGKLISKFSNEFGDKSQDLAKKLLKVALITENDFDIKKAIIERLKLLDSKPKNITKCSKCGNEFIYKKYRYGRQKTCSDCKNKKG